MCTIFTTDQPLWVANRQLFEDRLIQDSVRNSDGGSMLFLDPGKPENNTIFRSMNATNLVAMIGMLMQDATEKARVFVHMRMATTRRIGVAFTHGFDDHNGRVFMHNGVISNQSNMAVDSFNLAYISNEIRTPDVYRHLRKSGERYANIFVINTELYSYGVIRMFTGSLNTDGKGNYSTNSVGPISRSVKDKSYSQHYMPTAVIKSTSSYSRDYWNSGAGAATGFGSGRAESEGGYGHYSEWDEVTKKFVRREWGSKPDSTPPKPAYTSTQSTTTTENVEETIDPSIETAPTSRHNDVEGLTPTVAPWPDLDTGDDDLEEIIEAASELRAEPLDDEFENDIKKLLREEREAIERRVISLPPVPGAKTGTND